MLRRGRAEEECIVLAGFGSVLRLRNQLAVDPDRVVDEEGAVESLFADRLMDALRFLLQIGTVVEFSGYFQHSCIEHVGGIVDILDEIVCFRPFDENPLFQVLEQLVVVLVSGEIVEQCVVRLPSVRVL